MNPQELLRIVDSLHRDKNIDPEIVFQAVEAALVSAARKQYGDESEIVVQIDREDGATTASCNGEPLDPAEMIGRIGAQTAKQVIIQKIREAERDSLLDEYADLVGQMMSGIVQRNEGGATLVALQGVEAILPRSEQIPGESHHPNERVRAIIYEVKPQGNRVKVVLSRNHPSLVRRLFEQEIPEIADGVITVNAMAREPGYRSKVAVSSSDQRIDCVGACVGVRGNRIKNIIDELAGERIDIVRWSDDAEELICNALQPAEVEQVLLCDMIGRAIVLVREDQLSLAIGRRGQNVRLASKLCGWDIEIMTADELEEQIDRAVTGFSQLDGMTEDLAQRLVEQGYLSYDDLSVIEPDALEEMGELTEEQVNLIVEQAEKRAEEAELAATEERRRNKERERLEREAAEAEAAATAAQEAAAQETAGSDAAGEETAGEETAGEETAGEETAGEQATGEQAAGDDGSQAAAEGGEPAVEDGTDSDSDAASPVASDAASPVAAAGEPEADAASEESEAAASNEEESAQAEKEPRAAAAGGSEETAGDGDQLETAEARDDATPG